MRYILFFLIIFNLSIQAELEKSPLSVLKLDNIKQGSATTGSVNLQIVVNLRPGDKVQFTLPSGNTFLCLVKEFTVVEDQAIIKIFGDIMSPTAGGFGFIFSKKGHIAGAILLHKSKETYTLQTSNEDGAFYFIKSIARENIL